MFKYLTGMDISYPPAARPDAVTDIRDDGALKCALSSAPVSHQCPNLCQKDLPLPFLTTGPHKAILSATISCYVMHASLNLNGVWLGFSVLLLDSQAPKKN